MEVLTTILVVAAVTLIATVWLLTKTVSAIWRSRLFWLAAFCTAVILIPLTAGMSVAAVLAVLTLRVFLLAKVLEEDR